MTNAQTPAAQPTPHRGQPLPVVDNPGAGIAYELFLDCVHCGLCTAACPTYVELGNENDSPRGRIYLMRAVTDGRLELNHEVKRHLELCLDCRACETACPSGVQYGKLIEPFRAAMDSAEGGQKTHDWFHKHILFGLFPDREKLRRSLIPARFAQRIGLHRLLLAVGLPKLLGPRLGRLFSMLPKLAKEPDPLPHVLPAKGPRRARVGLFIGCVADALFRETHWATARVLQENGCEVIVSHTQVCCGAIHYHSGNEPPARALADANTTALQGTDVDAVIVNVAGCGSMLKDYGHHWQDERQPERAALASKIKDVSEFLDELGLVPPQGEIDTTVTYHDACHLTHAQQVRDQPRNLLRQIPGLKLLELPESELCCGAAGTYNLTEPELAGRLSRRKLQNILGTGARVVVTANTGCLMQIACEAREQGHALRIMHPMDLLDLSYRGAQLSND